MFGPPPVPSVRPEDVPQDVDAVVLDVREPREWTAGHMPGALHIPLADLPGRITELPAERDLLVVCRVGSRSASAVAWLTARGIPAVNLDGGMQAWVAAGRPLVSEGAGEPYVD